MGIERSIARGNGRGSASDPSGTVSGGPSPSDKSGASMSPVEAAWISADPAHVGLEQFTAEEAYLLIMGGVRSSGSSGNMAPSFYGSVGNTNPCGVFNGAAFMFVQ